MAEAHRRKKQPEALRSQLLRSAGELIAEIGPQALTLDLVAGRVGVSKGGLLHHFPNKQALLDAVFADAVGEFRDAVAAEAEADPVDRGRDARAYLRATLRKRPSGGAAGLLRHLLAVMLTESGPRERWSAQYRELVRPDPLPQPEAVRLMICRLATDGLWLADLLGYDALTPALRAEIVQQLERMTKDQDS
jgi:AcrR family transcriptional regulator